MESLGVTAAQAGPASPAARAAGARERLDSAILSAVRAVARPADAARLAAQLSPSLQALLAESLQSAASQPSPAELAGKHRFVLWLAAERRKREAAERQLDDAQEELARSEHSRRAATQRWLEAASQLSSKTGRGRSPFADQPLAEHDESFGEASAVRGDSEGDASRELGVLTAALEALPGLLSAVLAGASPVAAARAAAEVQVAQGRLARRQAGPACAASLAMLALPLLALLSWLLAEGEEEAEAVPRGAAAAGSLLGAVFALFGRLLRWLLSF